MSSKKSLPKSVIAINRGATYHYDIYKKIKAGIQLKGYEVKGLREKRANIVDGFIKVVNGEAFLMNTYIGVPSNAKITNYDSRRARRLLLHKREIRWIDTELKKKGITAVPLELFWENNLAKLLIGVGKGKKKYDKRKQIIEREIKREIQKALKYEAI